MGQPETAGTDVYRAATGIVTFLGLYQGAVPLVARGVFDRDQRFAPAMWLSSPWWWIACLAIVAVTIIVLAALHTARERRYGTTADRSQPTTSDADATAPTPTTASGTSGQAGKGADGYDALSGVVFLAGIYNGVAPFPARLLFDGDLLLAFPLRLSAPWWWITSLAVIATTAILLALIDQAKQRHADG